VITLGAVHAIIPTRGDVDTAEIAAELSRHPEIGLIEFHKGTTPFWRYLQAADSPGFPLIWTQDDDCVTDPRPAFEAAEQLNRVELINCMTPEHAIRYPGNETLLGFGALFTASLARKFVLDDRWVKDELFLRESDRIFGTINSHHTVFPRIRILDCAHNPNRYWQQPEHVDTMLAMRRRILKVSGIESGGL
jgi:hypothetical protein